jgi:SAM-dependent methyltransferase
VLDAGCELGDDTLELARLVGSGGRVVGVDVSQSMIDAARDRAAAQHLSVEFEVCDAQALPFADAGHSQPPWKLILTMFAAFAQFERELMLERQRAGIAKTKADGALQRTQAYRMASAGEAKALHARGSRTESQSAVSRRYHRRTAHEFTARRKSDLASSSMRSAAHRVPSP